MSKRPVLDRPIGTIIASCVIECGGTTRGRATHVQWIVPCCTYVEANAYQCDTPEYAQASLLSQAKCPRRVGAA